MNYFIIGNTKSGKTGVAKILQRKHKNLDFLSASEMIKIEFIKKYPERFSNLGEYVKTITNFSVNLLQNDPKANAKYLKLKLQQNKEKSFIIDGLRNPIDFMEIFNPLEDVIIYIDNYDKIPKTNFEEYGINAIRSYFNFLTANRMLKNKIIHLYGYSYEEIFEKFCEEIEMEKFNFDELYNEVKDEEIKEGKNYGN